MRAYLESQGNPRKKILIPDSAHGTNPATAATVGYQVENLRSNERGMVDLSALEAQMNEDVAGLMLTNPNTLGIFEEQIAEIAEILHRKGGLLYMDGANMNALVAKARPGDFGVDLMHLNLHKTFSTQHGGGGPGSGPVACKQHLEPYLPKPVLEELPDGTLRLDYGGPQSIGRVRAFFGNFGMHVRALAYIMANGPDGLRQTTEDAVLNANYLRKKLEGTFDLPYPTPSLHEVIFSDKLQSRSGIRTGDIAKRLIDYGFHPYTVSFPMVVPGALMIEPTESEPLEELDLFVDAMKSIAQEAVDSPELIKNAPYSTRLSRLDETAAARRPILRWQPETK
jgi:glycine dehydrogenase subunit 2